MTFRKKFFLSYSALLLIFLAALYPFIVGSVNKIVYNLLINRQDQLVATLLKAKSESELVEILKEQKHYSFFRIALHDSEQKVLYDSHTKRLNRPLFFPFQFTSHPEVVEALTAGQGYAEEYSEILGQMLIYVAKRFEVDNKVYALRLAFPYQYIEELRASFQTGFIILSFGVLLLFGFMAGLLLHKLTKSERIQHQLQMHYKIVEMKKDFIANASHELKTPITIIRGFAETLQDNDNLPRATCQAITEKIVTSCERMTKTIKNLLTLADIENMPESRRLSVDLVELAEECIATLQAAYKTAAVQFVYDETADYFILADGALIEVALMNLLDNAAKYANETPIITVSLEKEDRSIKLSVKDNGIGIAEQDLERIFQRFYRANKLQAKKASGSGLGLSLVETIIERHGGRIEVSSTPNQGSTFTLIFS